jgi:hypothetical protein
MILRGARPFSTGLPKGFSDLFGWVSVEVTEKMVGQRLAVFCAIEVKSKTGRVSPEQTRFVEAVQKAGGRAVIARGAEDLLQIYDLRG